MQTQNQKCINRTEQGSIMAIAAVLGVLVLVIGLWALDVFWLHFLSGKEMSAAEKVAMAAAVALNKNDSVGQMNFMLAHCRELIVCARYDETKAQESHPLLQKLAHDIAQHAHDSALQLEEERHKLAALRIEEAIAAADNAVATAGSPGAAHMAGVATSAVSINYEQSCFGCPKKTVSDTDSADNVLASNVEPSSYHFEAKIDPLLFDYDKKFIDETAKMYKGNLDSPIDLNFPGGGDDPDLQFLLSSLTPCINNYVSPPRLIQAKEFHKMSPLKAGSIPRYIPTAAYIVLQLDVKDTQSGASNRLMAPGVAVSGGGSAPP